VTGSAERPVFVVGVARSGTTLLRTILQGSGQVAVAPESHFVAKVPGRRSILDEVRRMGDLADDATMRELVEAIYAGRLAERVGAQPYLKWLVKRVPRAGFEARLLAGERSERGVFTAMLEAYAERRGAPRAGEKTPAHIRGVDTLLEWYPQGRVIHMVRDPRAIHVSELRRRVGDEDSDRARRLARVPPAYTAYVLLKTIVLWADAADRDRGARARFPDRYRRVSFEDLVQRPQDVVRDLFAFLDLDLTPAALDRKVVSGGFLAGEQGFDAGAATRWRGQIAPSHRRLLETMLSGRMRRMGYRPV
jgi:hypothetical protein